MQPTIRILPLCRIRQELLHYLIKSVENAFSLRVDCRSPMQEDMQYAYHAGRDQYYSSAVLERIPSAINKGIHILVIVDLDLFVPGLNFVFGEASPRKGVCIISLTRLRQEFYGLKPEIPLFFQRAAKEAVHELGHTFGLSHCRDSRCVMFFSNSLSDTDRKKALFCERCHKKLKPDG